MSLDFQNITLDLGGHGDSGTGRKWWTVDSFAQDVAAIVRGVDPEEAVLPGHSMGGNVAKVI
ncbi:alpha/beta fold hydrolase [Blastomonas sp.]|uniref:alpha/beta fold hydrolase n=1 Tax=Blastomonas sp. TaxID=1909299 RepID=UPI003593660C